MAIYERKEPIDSIYYKLDNSSLLSSKYQNEYSSTRKTGITVYINEVPLFFIREIRITDNFYDRSIILENINENIVVSMHLYNVYSFDIE